MSQRASNGRLGGFTSRTDSLHFEPACRLAAMSTTSDAHVAIKYAASSASLLLRLRTDTVMQRGASISFLSAFPAEAEGAE